MAVTTLSGTSLSRAKSTNFSLVTDTTNDLGQTLTLTYSVTGGVTLGTNTVPLWGGQVQTVNVGTTSGTIKVLSKLSGADQFQRTFTITAT